MKKKTVKVLIIKNKEYICLENINKDDNKILLYKWVDKKDIKYYLKIWKELSKYTI